MKKTITPIKRLHANFAVFAMLMIISLLPAQLLAVNPSLGAYPNVTLVAGSSATINPSAAPANTISATAYATAGFTGTLVVNPATGVVKVTDAKHAGVYTITIKAFGSGATSATATCILTVTNTSCSQGLFAAATYVNSGNQPSSVAVADFNNDGMEDIACANITGNNVSILTGNGNGSFSIINSDVSVGSQPYGVAVADFNGDGNIDIATANSNSNTVSVRMGDGNGNFSGTLEIAVGSQPRSLAIGDFNNDGLADIAVANFNQFGVYILLNDGAGSFTYAFVSVGTQPYFITVADFNNDGNQDIATSNYGSNTVSIRLGDGSGNLAGGQDVPVSALPRGLAVGDFNGDGKADIAVGHMASANIISIFVQNPIGTFISMPDINVGSQPLFITVGDFNGDGKQDITSANYGSGVNVNSLGNGDGTFGPIIVSSGGSQPLSLAVGDFNNDGKEDIATASSGSYVVSILLGGEGHLSVEGNNTTIADGDATPSSTDFTDFGALTTRTFTIRNNGNTAMTLASNSINFIGGDLAMFALSGITLPVTINAAGTATFTVTFTAASAGTKTTTIHITNNDCVASDYDFAIQAGVACSVGSTVSPSATVCAGTSVTLSGTGSTSYTWTGGVINGQSFVPMVTTTYTVTGVNTCGTNTATRTITVNPLPIVTASVSPSGPICAGTPVTLTAAGALTYSWLPGPISGSPVTVTPTATTTYTLTGTDANGCTGTAGNGWASISAGIYHTLAIKSDGTLWAWGLNDNGQIGNGITGTDQHSPVQVGTATNWVSIAAGYYHSLGVTSDGKLWAWGANSYGQIGDGTFVAKNIPVQVGSAMNWASVSAGNFHSIALKTNGTLFAFGSNTNGQLGIGSYTSQNIPVLVPSATTWASVTTGEYHTLGIKTGGTLWGWGANGYRQVGDGTTANRSTPVQIGTATNWSGISASINFSMGVRTDGTRWFWGINSYGQSGNGSSLTIIVPTQIGTASDWTNAEAGGFHSLGIKTNGTLWACGYNGAGQLGDGTTVNKSTPVQTGTTNNWVKVQSGARFNLGIKSNGSLWAWGENNHGQIGDGTTTTRINPLQIGSGINGITVTVKPSPTVTATASATTICAGLPVTLTGGGADSYAWSGGVTNATAFNPTTTTTYTVTGTNTNGCSNTATATVTVNPCNYAASLSLDGVNDYVNMGSSTALKPVNGLTVELWVYQANWNALPGYKTIIGNTETGGYALQFETGNKIQAWVYRHNGYGIATYIPTSLSAGWHHLAMTFDGQFTKLLVDGTQVAQNNSGGAPPYVIQYHPSNSTLLGAEAYTGATPQGNTYCPGKFDELRIWNYARTCAEIGAKKDCELAGNETGLKAYYKFNQGLDAGTNTGITSLTNTILGNNGTLVNFALTGAVSNWVAPGAVTSGVACTGTANSPEINVQGNGSGNTSIFADITDGDVTPDLANYTKYLDIPSNAIGTSQPFTFRIQNNGSAPLTLGTTPVSVTGTDAADFYVLSQPSSSTVSASGNTDFVIVFYPLSIGLKTATVHIANSDCDEGDYDFAIQGNCGCSIPDVPVITGSNTVCGMGTAIYTATSSSASSGITYNWTLDPSVMSLFSGYTIHSNPVKVNILTGASGSIIATASNACGTSSATTLLVTKKPQAPVITPPATSICGATTATYTANSQGAASYNWSQSGGMTLGTNGSATMTVTFPTAFICGTLTATPSNACGSGTSASISVYNKIPATPQTITGLNLVCTGSNAYSTTINCAQGYYWWMTGDATIGSSGGAATAYINPGFTSGTINVYAYNGCGNSYTKSKDIAKDNCLRGLMTENKNPNTEETKSTLFNLYPNPTNGIFTLSVNRELGAVSGEKLMVEIYDVLGNKVLQSEIRNSKSEISLESFGNGMYFVRVVDVNSNTVYSQRVVKE